MCQFRSGWPTPLPPLSRGSKMICWTTVSLLLIVVPPFASITEEKQTVRKGEDVHLLCVNSRSQDEVVWVTPERCKDDSLYIDKNLTPCTRRFHTFHSGVSGNQAEMILKSAHPLDSGYYICEHWLLDSQYRKIYIKVLDETDGFQISTLSTVLVVMIAASFAVFAVITLLKRKRKLKELRDHRKQLMEELFPFDSKWEFSPKDLMTTKRIGSGRFSQVMQARIGSNVVAVKATKSKTSADSMTLLVRQLKVLAKTGHHVNIVNLLGAMTKNIMKGELMLVLEYCRNGSLQDFIRANRALFISQIDEKENLASFSLAKTIMPENQRQYLTLPLQNSKGRGALHSLQGLVNSYCGWVNGQSNFIELEETVKEERRSILTTRDLIAWSHHIASGMNYLSKNKIIHGELSAKNVLLTEDNVAKITDIGISTEAFEKGCSRMWAWMAIESLVDRVFSSQSDVWSFGVTMWELFSLGQEPYSGIRDKITLASLLLSKKRLERPPYAPNSIADLVENCWFEAPNERVSFERLEMALQSLLRLSNDQNKREENNLETKTEETCIEMP